MNISADRLRYCSRWFTISAVTAALFIGVFGMVKAHSLGIDFDIHFQGPEEDRLEREYQNRENERAYDRVQDYHRDPDNNDRPSRSDYDKSFDYFRDNVTHIQALLDKLKSHS